MAIKVVCGVIYRDDKILICKRKANKSLGGFWEFPGGKVEENELYEDSLERELLEELGMQVDVKNFITSNVHDYGNFAIELIAYHCLYVFSNGHMKDHDEIAWVKKGELKGYEFAPADVPIVEKLLVDNE